MKRVTLIAIVSLASALLAGATDLDAPGAKPVSVRSEIERGHSAAITAAAATHGPMPFDKAISALIDQNVQNRTDSDGFKLGLVFGGWQHIWTMLSLGAAYERVGNRKLDESHLAAIYATGYFQGFRTFRERLGVTPDQLKDLFGAYGYDPQRDDAAWEAAVKSSKFRDTKLEVGPPKP